MEQYIPKSVLVAEIEKLRAKWFGINNDFADGQKGALTDVLSLLDTLEVKNVDLDESARHYLLYEHVSPLNEVLHQTDIKVEMQYHKDIEGAYKAGFELGLQIAQKGE